jgi:hypothetical protein
LKSTADTARTTARDLATGPVGQAVRERASELAVTSRELAQEKGAVARKAAEEKSREAAKKLNQTVNKTVASSTAAATVAKVRKDLEPRLAELGDLAGDVSQRAAGIATAASAAALAKLHEKERKQQRARRRRRRLIVLLLGAAVGAVAAARLRRKSDSSAGSAATAFGAPGPGTAAGSPVDTVPDAAATQETTPGATDLPPATSADANGDLKS